MTLAEVTDSKVCSELEFTLTALSVGSDMSMSVSRKPLLSEGAGLISLSTTAPFTVSGRSRVVSTAISCETPPSTEETSVSIGITSLLSVVWSFRFVLDTNFVEQSAETSRGSFDGSSVNSSMFMPSSLLGILGDKVCSNAVGAASVSEPEVASVPVSVPDEGFGGCATEGTEEEA